jgi:hypothetical protein
VKFKVDKVTPRARKWDNPFLSDSKYKINYFVQDEAVHVSYETMAEVVARLRDTLADFGTAAGNVSSLMARPNNNKWRYEL